MRRRKQNLQHAVDDLNAVAKRVSNRKCLCGCGQTPKLFKSKHMPGHSGKIRVTA